MTAKELYDKARKALKEAQDILAQEDPSEEDIQRADKLMDEADAYKAQADTKARADDMAAKFARPPFDFGEPDPDDGDVAGVKSADVDTVIQGIYGGEYETMLAVQRQAFLKFLRYGPQALQPKERQVLRQVILTPAQVKTFLGVGMTPEQIKVETERARKDLTEGSDTAGGFLSPEDFRAEIIRALPGLTVVRQRARVIDTSRDTVVFPKVTGQAAAGTYTSAVRFYWVSETGAASETEPGFGQERVPINKAIALTKLSQDQLEDSAFDIWGLLAELFAEAKGLGEDAAFLTGDGTGEPMGVMTEVSAGNIGNTVSGNASALTADGLIDLHYDLKAQYRQNAVFVMASGTTKAVRKLKDANDQYLWQMGIAAGQPDTLLGKPVAESEFMPAIAGDAYPILFGDFRRGYWIADRVGMSVQRLVEKYAENDEVGFKARFRLGGSVVATYAFQAQKIST